MVVVWLIGWWVIEDGDVEENEGTQEYQRGSPSIILPEMWHEQRKKWMSVTKSE